MENKRRTSKLIRSLIDKTQAEILNPHHRQKVLDLIETIVLYKLPFMSREDLAAMYTFTKDDLRKTRYYQEVRQEAREELAEEVRESVRQEVRESVEQEVRALIRQEVRESVEQEVRALIRQETSREEALKLVQRLVQRQLGALAPELDRPLRLLETTQLENLAEDLLDFQHPTDLANWLESLTIPEA